MRLTTAVLALLLLPVVAQPQSYWLDSDQSGAFFEPAYAWATDISSRGLAFGYASEGRADLGLSFSRTNETMRYLYWWDDPDNPYIREVKFESWTTSQFFLSHLYKTPAPAKSCFTFSVLERFSFVGESLLPKKGTLKVLTLGGFAGVRIKPSEKVGYLLSGGYMRIMPLESGMEDANAVSAKAGLALYGSRVVKALYFEYARSEGISSYAISLSLGQINQKKRDWSDE